jgi:hypothetical protein
MLNMYFHDGEKEVLPKDLNSKNPPFYTVPTKEQHELREKMSLFIAKELQKDKERGFTLFS